MASINKLVTTAHKLGISLEQDMDELDRIVDKWNNKYPTSQDYAFRNSRFTSIMAQKPTEDESEEAWIQEAWL